MDVVKQDDLVKSDGDEQIHPGKIIIDYSKTTIEINNSSSDVIFLSVTNISDEPISIGSHFNFIEANKSLKFDRALSFGMRLVI
jgi:urease beta subunit